MQTILEKRDLETPNDGLVAHLDAPHGEWRGHWRVVAERADETTIRVVECSFFANGSAGAKLDALQELPASGQLSFGTKDALAEFLDGLTAGNSPEESAARAKQLEESAAS